MFWPLFFKDDNVSQGITRTVVIDREIRFMVLLQFSIEFFHNAWMDFVYT